MKAAIPHYMLYCESCVESEDGRWRFVLRSADGADRLEAEEVETGARGERLELLAVVRGLEALDQASRVTLLTASTYVREGIRHGVVEWKKNGWCWEFFGHMVPVKHQDLWKRIDRALAFHSVECRTTRVDPAHAIGTTAANAQPHLSNTCVASAEPGNPMANCIRLPKHPSTLPATRWKRWRQWFATAWMTLAPSLGLG